MSATDELLEEILVDAYGEDEQLWSFRQAFEDELELPGKAVGKWPQEWRRQSLPGAWRHKGLEGAV